MTVAELIRCLEGMPPEAIVVYDWGSDFAQLTPDEVVFTSADESRRKVEAVPTRTYTVSDAYVLRAGAIVHAYPLKLWPEGETPVYVDVVCINQ